MKKSAPLKYVNKLQHNTFIWEWNMATLITCFHKNEIICWPSFFAAPDIGLDLCIVCFLCACFCAVNMCLLVGASEFCVFAIYNDHVAGFADWPPGHALRLYWCSINQIFEIYISSRSIAVHTENMVSGGEVENSRKGNEVNNLFLGLSFNRITNDFPVANGRTIPRCFALARTCATDSLAVSVFSRFLILLHMFGLFWSWRSARCLKLLSTDAIIHQLSVYLESG